jgi:hypothetical protein
MAIQTITQQIVDGNRISNVSISRTPTATNYDNRRVTITQSGEVEHTFSTDITNPHEVTVENKDATNFITFGFATGVYYLKVWPGEMHSFSVVPTVSSFFAIADTADCECVITVKEE